MKRQLILYILLAIVAPLLHAQDIRFYVSGPSQVEKGKRFQVEYVVEGTTEGNVTLPSFDGCQNLYVSSSVSQYTQMVNGKSSSKVVKKQIVSLRADNEGTFTFEPAKFSYNGKSYETESFTLKVVPAVQSVNTRPSNAGSNTITSQAAPEEIAMRWILTKTSVYEGEALYATLRLYSSSSRISLNALTLPNFEGFVSKRLDIDSNWTYDTYNNKSCYAVDIAKVLLFPQQVGDVAIGKGDASIESAVVIGYSAFGYPITDVVSQDVTIPSVKIKVKPRPQPVPPSFIGGVGDFTVESKVSATEMKANEALTYTITIAGKGNFEMMQSPALQLSSEFDMYDPQVSLDIHSNGLNGKRVMEYVLVPRYAGTFNIPAIDITYFNTTKGAYETAQTTPYTIEVSQAEAGAPVVVNNFSGSTQGTTVEVADVLPIKGDSGKLSKTHSYYVSSFAYWLWYIIPILLVVVAVIGHRMYIASHADAVAYRNRKANKVALRRLRKAGSYLKQRNEALFYEEVLRAIWGYLGDKLAIPTAELSRENIQAELLKYGIEDNLIQQFTQVIDNCEYARYAPASAGDMMAQLYDETLSIMSEMENVIKVKK